MRKKILIVEDELPIAKVLSDKFKENDFDVFEAHEGFEGLRFAFEKHPDIILLDIIMPKMDGITMLQKLRKDSWGKNVPVLILTNLTDASKVSQVLSQDVFDYLVKTDWKLDEVVHAVNEKLGIKPLMP